MYMYIVIPISITDTVLFFNFFFQREGPSNTLRYLVRDIKKVQLLCNAKRFFSPSHFGAS